MKDESRPALPALPVNGLNGAHAASTAIPVRPVPDNVAVKCPNCKELLVGKDWEKNLKICQRCGHHFRLSAPERISLLLDPDSFDEFARDVLPRDPLSFVSRAIAYTDDLKAKSANTDLSEAVLVGYGRIEDLPLVLAVMDFRFIGGSMGAAVGERITQAIERAAAEHLPLLIVSTSGGARMQEGMISLMQMAKTSAALSRLADAGTPFISLLTDPTTGGVMASFASLGDIILAEPGALIGFAGPRVIEQAIHQRLPKDANTAEFVQQHGMLDAIVHRRELRPTLARLLRLYQANERRRSHP